MTKKQLEKARTENGGYFGKNEQLASELCCIEMINSILIYNYKPQGVSTEERRNKIACEVLKNTYLNDYINGSEYHKALGESRVKELILGQLEDFQHCQVGFAGCDGEGLSYNYCLWADEQ